MSQPNRLYYGDNLDVLRRYDLRGVIEREKAEIGVLITIEEVTKPMQKEAAGAGFYKSPVHKDYPRLQLLSIAQLIMGATVDYPRLLDATFKQAPKARGAAAKNMSLPLGDDTSE